MLKRSVSAWKKILTSLTLKISINADKEPFFCSSQMIRQTLKIQNRDQTASKIQSFPLHSKSKQWQFSKAQYGHNKANPEDGESEGSNLNGKANFQLHKSRGQHILTNPRVLNSIAEKAGILRTDTVLEIGPGTGNLTVRLLEQAKRVIAVEVDERMVDALKKRVEHVLGRDKLTIIAADVLKTKLPKFDLCVANIPYGISSPIIARLFFETQHSFRNATLLLQKEFAERLVAKPGDPEFNRLAANVGLVAEIEMLMTVSKREFVPCPKVDSAVVKIQHKTELPNIDLKEWLAFTNVCFGNKNKTLGAIFRQKKRILEMVGRASNLVSNGELGASEFKERIFGILKMKGFDEKRPSKMSHEELLEVLQLFNQDGVIFNHYQC